MIFFGHVGITAFILALFFLPALAAGIGGILPDIFDKAAFLLGIFPCTRFFGHTIFFVILVGIATFVITRKKSYALAISFGSLFHLIQDLQGNVPFFYPLVNYPFLSSCGEPSILYHLNIIEIVAEVVGVVLLIILIKYWKQFEVLRNKLWSLWKK